MFSQKRTNMLLHRIASVRFSTRSTTMDLRLGGDNGCLKNLSGITKDSNDSSLPSCQASFQVKKATSRSVFSRWCYHDRTLPDKITDKPACYTCKYIIDATGHIYTQERKFYDRYYFWPIPQSELDISKNLLQNPGYPNNTIYLLIAGDV